MMCLNTVVFAAPPTAGTIDRSQEIIQKDEILTQKIGQEQKFFIGKIDIKGASKLSSYEVKNIITPFQRNLLTKKDFQKIINALKAAYAKKGFDVSHLKIAYAIKKQGILEIKVNELTR